MNDTLKLIETLGPYLAEYVNSGKPIDAKSFAAFLQEQHWEKEALTSESINLIHGYNQNGVTIAFHLNRLNKYAKYYIKEALKDSDLLNADDFGFLATVIERQPISKSEVIAFNVHEVPSGMEVIKRLLKNGLIREEIDLNDRRIKMLFATELGMGTLFQTTAKLQKVAKIVVGKLSEDEQRTLIELMQRLDHFHEDIYQNESSVDLDQINNKYLS